MSLLENHGSFVLRNIGFAEFSGVSIDSRNIPEGYIFCALKGEHTDGHSYVAQALTNGAKAALVDKNYAMTAGGDEALIIVDETYQGLVDMATIYAHAISVPILAITGSAGKTSTRSLIAHVLRHHGMMVRETPKNFNNHIGLPISVLQIHERDEIAILEMGTSGIGEIRNLCEIAVPDYGIITSIAHAHIGGFGSIDNVQIAKYELLDAVKENGILFINNDDPRVAAYPKDERKRITYAINNEADVKFDVIDIDNMGKHTLGLDDTHMKLQSSGRGAAINAVVAYAFASTIGLDERETITAIESFEPARGRGKIENWKGIILIDDTYNANPFSVKNAIHALEKMDADGKKLMVFGDMLEMGPEAKSSHVEIGRECVKAGISHLYCLGNDSVHTVNTAKYEGIPFAKHFLEKKELASTLMDHVEPGDIVLFKGSRGIATEEIITLIKDM